MTKLPRFRSSAAALAVLAVVGLAGPARAWVYPEHRDIALLAVEKLDAERRPLFDRLWREARAGHETRLCEQAADTAQGVAPGLPRLGGLARDRRRPLVLEQEHARQRTRHRLDPAGRRRGGAVEGGPRAHCGHRPAGGECPQQGRGRRYSAPDRGRGPARPAHQRPAHLGHPPAAGRRRVRDPRRLQQRALPDPAAAYRHHAQGVRGTGPQLRLRDQRGRRLRLVSRQCACRRPRGWPPSHSRLPNGRHWRGRCWPTRASRCTSWRTPSRPATSPGPGATCRSARAPTTTTTRPGWRYSPGRAAANRWC